MSEQLSSMKNAVMGEGDPSGLQSISATAGQLIGNNADTRSSSDKAADDASKSLGDFAKGGVKGGGQTSEGTNVSASDQVANMQSGTADHLGVRLNKET